MPRIFFFTPNHINYLALVQSVPIKLIAYIHLTTMYDGTIKNKYGVTTSILNYITGHKIFHQETDLLATCSS